MTETLEGFVERIVKHIRGRKEFWMNEKIVRTKENEEK